MSGKGKSSKSSKGKSKEGKDKRPALAHSTKGIEKKKDEVHSNPVGSRRLEEVVWESSGDKRIGLPPVNGHTGVFAYHMDDCLCGMGGWPCYRDGSIWSCCGSTDKHSYCELAKEKKTMPKETGESSPRAKGRKKKGKQEMNPYPNRIKVVWEGTNKVSGLPPIRGHTGVFALHMDDCMCGMGGWPCYRDGYIWSCCGSTDENSNCSNAGKNKDK